VIFFESTLELPIVFDRRLSGAHAIKAFARSRKEREAGGIIDRILACDIAP
jgi:hypothetical protein